MVNPALNPAFRPSLLLVPIVAPLLALTPACGEDVNVDVGVVDSTASSAISTSTCVTLSRATTNVEDATLDRSSVRGAALTLESDNARRMALQFDVSSLRGAQVTSANLVLQCRDKGKLTAPRRPANIRAITRALVGSWINDPAQNQGIAIDEDNTKGTSCQSSEASSGQPALEVCFSLLRSCSELHAAQPTAPSGSYLIDTDGAGPNAPITVECDMSHDGGGWTLVMATRGVGPTFLSGPNTSTTTPSALDRADLVALAGISQQVHLRTAGVPSDSITTRAGTTPIQNLRNGNLLYTSTNEFRGTDFFGARSGEMAMFCEPAAVSYPNLYHACGNTSGLHLIGDASRWVFFGSTDNLELWVRDAAVPTSCSAVFAADPTAASGTYFLTSGYTTCTRPGGGGGGGGRR